jgi:2-hydroxychromene-2-carboxylate isomerase
VKSSFLRAGVSASDFENYLTQASQEKVKEVLKKVTEEAVQRGSFGAPSMFVKTETDETEQMFFGCDRVSLMFDHVSLLLFNVSSLLFFIQIFLFFFFFFH